jgi:glutamate synthase (ferredoxin)
MAALGFRTMDEMIGRSDLLDMAPAVEHFKAKGLDFSRILHRVEPPNGSAIRKMKDQDHGLEASLDMTELVPACAPALERGEAVSLEFPIRNVNRSVGTILGSELTRRYGGAGLPDDTIQLRFSGSAGQSFGAFLPRGISLTLDGDANDYVGKGLSGGKVVVHPPACSPFKAEENVLIGNVALYGATSGRAFFRGKAGERFAVRNSGAHTVVEGTGDHACEYMTGGVVVILGPTGRNVAAGMSGGVAFIHDADGELASRCNLEMVALEKLEEAEDVELVRDLLLQHIGATGSEVAKRLLGDWENVAEQFVKIMPTDYRRVLAEQKARQAAEADAVAAV